MRKILIGSGLVLFLVGLIVAWRAMHPPLSDPEQIAAAIAAIEDAANSRTARGITAHLSDDFQWGGDGRKELGQQLAGAFFQFRGVRLRTSGVSTQISGDEATTQGHFTLELRQEQNSTPEVTTGDFKAWWRKENGEWKITKAEGSNLPH